jgi:hypothetical protein
MNWDGAWLSYDTFDGPNKVRVGSEHNEITGVTPIEAGSGLFVVTKEGKYIFHMYREQGKCFIETLDFSITCPCCNGTGRISEVNK